MEHADYPHWPGTLYDCYACEVIMDQEEQNVAEEDGRNDGNIVLDWELNDETLSGESAPIDGPAKVLPET